MLMTILLCILISACQPGSRSAEPQADTSIRTDTLAPPAFDAAGNLSVIDKPDALWRKELAPKTYNILREAGTERAFTGAYWDHHEQGTYACAGCALPLFNSATKFDSGTGWPSFYDPVDPKHVTLHEDASYGMRRVEVRCARCGGHQGHVFDDGPAPTGMRYCINSAALQFVQDR
jgi:peptide-methionine (R)-S-oxide reductase